MIWIYSYSYNYLTRTLFVIHSAMVLISIPVGPRPCYDSDVVYSLLKLVVAFRVYDKLCPSSWHRYLYVGGSWTGNSNRPYCREVKFSWRRKQLLEGKNKKKLRRRRWYWSCMLRMSSMITRSRWMQCAWRLERLENMPFIPRLGIIMPLDQLLPWLRLWSHLFSHWNVLHSFNVWFN